MTTPEPIKDREEHESKAKSTGASSPGEQGYSGEVTIGDEGGAAGPESFFDPTGTGREGGPEIASDLEHELAQRRPKE